MAIGVDSLDRGGGASDDGGNAIERELSGGVGRPISTVGRPTGWDTPANVMCRRHFVMFSLLRWAEALTPLLRNAPHMRADPFARGRAAATNAALLSQSAACWTTTL